mmetsp:Transcript_36357/g.74603  ORF Transcript_36357/g.74603 Transcript_36357/m.74603 type:complete len:84 (-) Transcript_36357:66-317(-)
METIEKIVHIVDRGCWGAEQPGLAYLFVSWKRKTTESSAAEYFFVCSVHFESVDYVRETVALGVTNTAGVGVWHGAMGHATSA